MITVDIPEAEKEYVLESTNSMKINGNKVEVKLYTGAIKEFRNKPKFACKSRAYGNRKKLDI